LRSAPWFCFSARRASNLDANRVPLVSLDGLWRFHAGDDPGWAAPDFDDSAWPLLRSDRSWSMQRYPSYSGHAWYRFSLRVPAGTPSLTLLMPEFVAGYIIYVDGSAVGSWGATKTAIRFPYPIEKSWALTSAPASAPRVLYIAVRAWHSPIWASYFGGGPSEPGALAGETSLIAARLQAILRARAADKTDLYIDAWLRFFIGLIILGLFLLRPGEREYLWFAAILLFGGADNLLNFFQDVRSWVPIQLFDLCDATLAAGFWIAGLFFFAIVLRQRRDLWFRVALALDIVSPFPTFLYWYGWVPVPVAGACTSLLVCPVVVWVLTLLIRRSLRGEIDARLMLLPMLLVYGDYLAFNLQGDLQQVGIWPNAPDVFNLRFHLFPFDLGIYTLFNILFLAAMLAFLIRRFALARSREEHLRGELEAASQVQALLVPESAPSIPGFKIDPVYLPAETVGGDFFQCVPDGEDGLLLVIGDVAGKGLPAAMMVSMLVGAIRAEARHSSDPAALLAVRIRPDGNCLIANAGHIPPYRNGEEYKSDYCLPLGGTADAQYASSTLILAPDDTLTFLSDSVVEAQNASGQLFGFDRARAISRESAENIALAASTHGQQDDITVLTLTMTGVEGALA
jgi:phosphoserine phosphatase RsbU/P